MISYDTDILLYDVFKCCRVMINLTVQRQKWTNKRMVTVSASHPFQGSKEDQVNCTLMCKQQLHYWPLPSSDRKDKSVCITSANAHVTVANYIILQKIKDTFILEKFAHLLSFIHHFPRLNLANALSGTIFFPYCARFHIPYVEFDLPMIKNFVTFGVKKIFSGSHFMKLSGFYRVGTAGLCGRKKSKLKLLNENFSCFQSNS